jgi:hypothetical protein
MGIFQDCGCGCKGKVQEEKFMISLMSAAIFFIVANPETFKLMGSVFGKWISDGTGCATTSGLLFHSLVFLLITWGLMNIKKSN